MDPVGKSSEEMRDRLKRIAYGLRQIGELLQEWKILAMLGEGREEDPRRFLRSLEDLREMLTELLTLILHLPEDRFPEAEEIRQQAIAFLDLTNEIQDLLEGSLS